MVNITYPLHMTNMNIIHETPVIQSVAKTGKTKYWKGVAFEEAGSFFYKKIWWQENSKVQESTPTLVKGKNIGKANETTDSEQVILELESIETKQRHKGYSEDGSKDHIPTKPMLAHKYTDKQHKVSFPCYVQPKLDGFRMIMDGKGGWTRGAKAHVQECIDHLVWDTNGYEIDGELMLPGNVPLQETASAAKKYRKDISPTLLYMVYDVVDPDMPYFKRHALLQSLAKSAPANVRVVETYMVNNEKELFEMHAAFTRRGFEGTIVRNVNGKYSIGHRSVDLLKVKDFQDGEFKVLDVKEGKGSFEGVAIFVCDCGNGEVVDVVCEGTMEYRQDQWTNKDKYIGKWLTIRYQTLSNLGVPIFPVGVDFREEGEF